MQGSGDTMVLGVWDNLLGIEGGYVDAWRQNGGLLYQSHPDVYTKLKEAFPDNYKDILWDINQTALQKQIDNGTSFEYTLNGVIKVDNEKAAVEAIWSGANDVEILSLLNDPEATKVPGRINELRELYNANYQMVFDPSINSYILRKP
jgi:hypothetical protein